MGCEVMKNLLESQQRLEQRAFDAINEQDKLLNFIRDMRGQIGELGNSYDLYMNEVEITLNDLYESGDIKDKEELNRARKFREDISVLKDNLIVLLDGLMEHAEFSSEVIHGMEEEIALSQDAVNEVKKHLEQQILSEAKEE